jgi:hypothetical protein
LRSVEREWLGNKTELEMEEQKYKRQVIRLEIVQPSETRHWTGKAQVQYNNGLTSRFFSVEGILEQFASRTEAEQYVVEAAKKLIDSLI